MATSQRAAAAFLQLLNFHGIAMIDPDVDVACRGVVEKAQDLTDMIARSYLDLRRNIRDCDAKAEMWIQEVQTFLI